MTNTYLSYTQLTVVIKWFLNNVYQSIRKNCELLIKLSYISPMIPQKPTIGKNTPSSHHLRLTIPAQSPEPWSIKEDMFKFIKD